MLAQPLLHLGEEPWDDHDDRTAGPGTALDLIESERVTATLLVPTMLAAISDEQLARPRDVGSLSLLSHGGAPVATETLRRAYAAFPGAELMHLYGTTETAPIATILPHEEGVLHTPQARSCGQPAVGVEVIVLDLATGGQAPGGTVGEVAIRGEHVMQGYWNKPEATAGPARRLVPTNAGASSCTRSLFSVDDPDGISEPVIVEAGYFLVRVEDGQGTGFATGPEPSGEWSDDLLGQAERTLLDREP